MQQGTPFVPSPVRNAQAYLRNASRYYDEIPSVIPDGIYGEQTRQSVIGFQNKFGLPPTGEIDNDTWNSLVSVNNNLNGTFGQPRDVRIFPNPQFKVEPGQSSVFIFPIQAMMHVLSRRFPQFGDLDINGVNDEKCTNMVRNMQNQFGLPENGIIDKQFWEKLAPFYEAHISRNRTKQ